ncbi:hypothetical protein EMPS_00865 [Entomortierella parvispora]|uniref:Sphingomyelin synthase-like domain-containing protein n=1 Tax=Entomortierella parvispora TaxID=205924 RepID=A0A9P3H1T5_9FUNG|nr:hypothetical protein EMPS_00865 [Entomortierella parvispora]
MSAQGGSQSEKTGSAESLGRSGLDAHDRNRNSNTTMVGNSNVATAATSVPRGESPLRSNHDDKEYNNNNSNSSLGPNENPAAAAVPSAKPVTDDRIARSRMGRLWHQFSSPIARSKVGRLCHRFNNSETGRFVWSVVYFAVVCIGMAFCNQFSDHRWIDTGYRYVILEDRGFDIFPALSSDTPANIFVMTTIVFTVIGMAFICPNWTTRGIVLRRVFWVVGTLSVYRALTLSVTTLPSPKVGCKPADNRTFWGMFWIAIQMIPGTVEACTDDIFSGHTVFMVTCVIQWRLYCRNKWITYLSYCYITVGLYYVIATRLHYTVDVVLAIFITYAAWSLYMAMVDVVMEKEYFGHRRQRDKYLTFGHHDVIVEDAAKDAVEPAATGSFESRRAQVNARLNRMRGPGIGYDRTEHDCVAFAPMQYNTWLTGAIRWCDGLDLRMHKTGRTVDTRAGRSFEDDATATFAPHVEQKQHVRDTTIAPVALDSIVVS